MTALDNVQPKQFYHVTTANIREGEHVESGHAANFGLSSSGHSCFTDDHKAARYWSGQIQQNDRDQGRISNPKILKVQPTGAYESDPTGETGHDLRSTSPLKVTGRA